MSDSIKTQKEQLAGIAMENPDLLKELVSRMEGTSRRVRQNAASVLAVVSHQSPELLMPYANSFVAALDRSEAQTKWESIDILAHLMACGFEVSDSLLDMVEDALFDEDSGSLRLAAMKFVCSYGSKGERAAVKSWPLIDEAIQCYHGDPEFSDMLSAVLKFAQSGLPADVSQGLKTRLSFDASHARGSLKKRAQQIIDVLD